MKLFGKLLIAALVIGILLPFTILKGKDGRTLMHISDLKVPGLELPDLPKISSLPTTSSGKEVANSSAGTVIYQWKDSGGNIQFTSNPPSAGVEYTVKGYDPNTNVIQSVKLPEVGTRSAEQGRNEETTKNNGISKVYSPKSIEKLFDDANNVEKLLNDRLKKQTAAIGD